MYFFFFYPNLDTGACRVTTLIIYNKTSIRKEISPSKPAYHPGSRLSNCARGGKSLDLTCMFGGRGELSCTRRARAQVIGCWPGERCASTNTCSQLTIKRSLRVSCAVQPFTSSFTKSTTGPSLFVCHTRKTLSHKELECKAWFWDFFITCRASWSRTAKVSSPGRITWDCRMQSEGSLAGTPSLQFQSPLVRSQNLMRFANLWGLCALTHFVKVTTSALALRQIVPFNPTFKILLFISSLMMGCGVHWELFLPIRQLEDTQSQCQDVRKGQMTARRRLV